MVQEMQPAQKREIYSLLSIVTAGLVAAALLTVVLTYYYTTEGVYRAKNVMVEPSLLPKLRYSDHQGERGDKSTYVFHNIVLTYKDSVNRAFRNVNLSQRQYQDLYTFLSGDSSLSGSSEDQEHLYASGNSATLSLILWNKSSQALYTFMRMEIAPDGDHYRIQIRDNQATDTWAYFDHHQIMQVVLATSRR